ncbi:hypothetical protein C1645_839258, partial [Glomus cerebriforme]
QQREELLAELLSKLDCLAAEIAKLQSEKVKLISELTASETSWKKLAEGNDLATEILTLREKIKELELALAGKESENDNLQAELGEEGERAGDLQLEKSAAEAANKELKDKLAQQDTEIKDLNQKVGILVLENRKLEFARTSQANQPTTQKVQPAPNSAEAKRCEATEYEAHQTLQAENRRLKLATQGAKDLLTQQEAEVEELQSKLKELARETESLPNNSPTSSQVPKTSTSPSLFQKGKRFIKKHVAEENLKLTAEERNLNERLTAAKKLNEGKEVEIKKLNEEIKLAGKDKWAGKKNYIHRRNTTAILEAAKTHGIQFKQADITKATREAVEKNNREWKGKDLVNRTDAVFKQTAIEKERDE